jgi:hypothetical protein
MKFELKLSFIAVTTSNAAAPLHHDQHAPATAPQSRMSKFTFTSSS